MTIQRKMTYARGIKANLSEQDIAWNMTEEDFKKQKNSYLKRTNKQFKLIK
jgi:hypothetical protein